VNQQIVLRRHPVGAIREDDFALAQGKVPVPGAGQFVTRNLFLSMDAGFRQWMSEGAGDNYLPGMRLGEPVQSMVLGRVSASAHPDFPVGCIVSARSAWEEYSLIDGSDLCTRLEVDPRIALREYVAALGPTGLTAHIGMRQFARPRPGDVLVVSAAAGAVGSVAGQIGRISGCRTIGLTSTERKARWLVEELGFDRAISREREPDLAQALAQAAPGGIDVFFDNVGGAVLDTVLPQLREHARIVLCGAVAQYESATPAPVYNTWHLVTKRATASGFMFSDFADEFPAAIAQLSDWLLGGELTSACQVYRGIASAPQAFCDMMHGLALGKCLVEMQAP